jgi:hypothetical protein
MINSILQNRQTDELGATYVAEDPYSSDSPEIKHCLSYWDGLRGHNTFPSWNSFDWLELPLTIIPHCGVVDVIADPVDFIYRFWGTAHASAMGQELTGKSVCEMKPEAEGRSVFDQYAETLQTKKPQMFVNTLYSYSQEKELKEISLRLPFAEENNQITHILAFSDMRQNLKDLETAFLKAIR